MIKSLLGGCLAVLLMCPLTGGAAENNATAPLDSAYERVTPPQPVSDPSKVEVIEFFWYGCPHCYHFEPDLNAWLKKKPANVTFIRQPAVFNEHWAAHAKAFYTAEALGVLDKMHGDFYDAVQNKKRTLESEDDLADFFAEHGVDKNEFHKAYRSFSVDARTRQAEALGPRYGITGTPSLVINGKYRVSGSTAKSFTNMLNVTDALIKQESQHAKK
jgi:protein dithiol oxidoreductase (disulfide-forming)